MGVQGTLVPIRFRGRPVPFRTNLGGRRHAAGSGCLPVGLATSCYRHGHGPALRRFADSTRHSSLPRRPGHVRSGLACWSHGHERTTGVAGCPRRARGMCTLFVPWGKSFDGARRGREPVRCPARGAPAAYRHTRPGFKKSAHVRFFFLILGEKSHPAIPVHRPSGLQAAGLLG
jgi:hypothetical protein